MAKISIIIRVKNERKNLERLFALLKNQSYQDFEVIGIDNMSTDGTFEFLDDHCEIVQRIEKFTYWDASNLGAKYARGEYLYYTSAHCYPVHSNLLETIATLFSKHPDVDGIYGQNLYDPLRGNIVEQFVQFVPDNFLNQQQVFANHRSIGLLQTTSSAIRAAVFQRMQFEPMENGGGEDAVLGNKILLSGKKIIMSPALNVLHSHGERNYIETFKRFMIDYPTMNREVVQKYRALIKN